MTNNEYVEKLYKRENELIKICNYHNIFNFECEDIIQELYVILLKFNNIDKYTTDDEPNMYIIFAILKNLIYHYRKKENKYNFDTIDKYKDKLFEEENTNDKYEFIINEINTIDNWFKKRILELYIINQHTIRSLAKETKIGTNVIQPIVHKFKEQVVLNYKKNQKL
jgi:DNA-directed RNA polymerase specialized sigma24 family protein